MFLAAVFCTLAVPALAQNSAGEAANLERKETGVDAEEHPMRSDSARKATPANRHNARVAATHLATHPKSAAVQRAATQQHSTAKLKTGQLTSGQSAKLRTKPTTLHREVHQDREDNGQQAPGEKSKDDQQTKTSNDIRLKKHNARMF
jgi:hypothetical protein